MSRCKGVAAKVRLSALILLVLAFSPYSCDLFNAGLGNKVDINPPEVRITSPENNAYIGYSGEGLVVRGTASDDLGLKSVTLSWDGGSREAVVSGQKWAVTFTPDAPLPDGRYVFTARATDGSKKISEWQSTVNVDSKPPLVDVIFDSDRGKSIANAFNGIDTIRGIADDGTGRLASVLVSLGGVQIFPNAANPNPSISELNSWQALVDFTGLKGKTGSWVNAVSSPVSGSTSDELVSAILHVDALDAAGNTASNEWTVYVDSSFDMPRVTYSGIFNTSIPFPRNPLIHHENIFRENDVFEFTVSDDDAVDRASAKLTILKKDAPIGDTLVYTVASGGLGVSPNSSEASKQARFSFTIPTGWLGEYSLRFEVSDSAEAKASMPVSVYTSSLVSIVVDSGTVNLDLTATPSPIVKPAELLIEGDATHLLGITSVILNLKDEGTGISTPYPLSLVGNHFSWTETGLEGVYSAKIVATSTTGKFADRTVNFTVDGTAPSIAFNAVGPIVAPNKVNGRLRASVTASDLNGLAGVRYWVLSDPAAPLASWTWASPSFVSLASAPYEAVIDTTALSGSKILRFGALDKAGNVNFIDYAPLSVDQNSDNPRIDITNLNASVGTFAGAVTNLLESNARIIGSLSDDDGIASGAVQLRYTPSLASAASPLAYGAWIPLASTSTSFDYGFPPAVSEGVHAFEITVQDNAAQKDGFPAVSTTIGPVFIAIDRSAPTLTVTSPTIDSYKGLGDFSITGTAFDQNGIKNINSDAGDVPDVVVRTINNDFSDTLNNIYVAVDGGGNWSYTFTVPAGADYSQTFYLMTQDKFNKQTVVTHRIKFDTVAPTLTILAPADGAWVSGSTLNISGTASDGVGSGVKNIYWWVGDAAAIPPDTISNLAAWNGLSGGSTWAALVDLAAMAAEGSKKLHVFATDNAGNSSQLLSPVVRAFGLDRSAPSVTETTVGITPVDKKDAFSFNGVFSDTNAISSAVITQQKDGGAINEIVNLPGLSGTSSAWSLSNLPRDPTNLPNLLVDDGNYVYEIKVSDIAGKATTLTRNVRIDTKPPNILSITAPLAGQVGLSALSGTTYRFQGSASDEVSGMKKLYYFISASSTPPADSSGYDFLNIGNGTWSFIEDFDIDGLGPDTGRAEGTWYLHVLSEDAAGNQTPAAVSVLFDIDHANPTLTETAINTASVTARGSGFSLSGTSADTHGIQSIAISQSKDGGPALGITPNGPSGTTSWNLANLPRAVGDLGNQALVDGVYTYVVTATDLSGKTTSLTRTVQLDTTPPDLVVTAPVNGGSVDTQTYTLRGTATEIGGVGFNPASDVEYSFDAGAAWQDMSLTGIAWNETVDLGAAQGSRALLVRATDKVGNRSTVSVAFNYDNAPPTLTETGVGSALLYSRSDLAFVGTLKDTNAVANISVSYLKQGDSIPVSLLDQAKTGSNIDVAWNLAVDVDTDGAALGDTSGLNDGNYVFTITARDAAGKTAVLTRNVIIDATAPDLPLFTSVQGPYLTSSLSVAGTASDTTSGVSKLYYRIDTAASTPVPTGTNNWFLNLNIGSSGLNLAEGPHTIYVWSEDKAGNLSGEAQQAFVVDRNDPSISVTGYASTEYRSDTFTISGTAADSLSLGLSPLYATLTKDGVPLVLGPLDFTYLVSGDTKSATWSLVIDKARGTGLYAASIQGVDAVGRPAQPKTISVILDTLKPSLTITEPLNAALVEKAAYSAQGTATDSGGSGVDRLEYSVDYAGDPLTATWLPAIGTASWAASLSLTDGLAKTFAARAIDRAGNISDPVSVNYKVDLANPDLSETAINTTALVSRNSQVDFAGFASDANGLASFKVSYIKDGGAPVEQTIVPAVGTGAWTWSLPVNTATHANDGLYEISFIATDNSLKAGIGKTTTVLRNVTVDSTPPALEIFPLSPMLSGSRVNGKITLQANASDAYGLTGLKYFLRSDASTPSYTDAVSLPLSGVLAAPYTASINTIGLTDNTTYTLWLIARDRAGNDAIASTTLRVEQASDIPTGSISSPLTGALLGADKKVRGFMSDDDGIELGGAQLYARKGNSGVFTAVPIAFSSSAGQLVEWNADLSTVVAAGDGSYELYLSISDDGSKKAGLASVAYTGATQTFFYDVSPPSLSSITASPAKSAYKVGDSIVLEWTATDASGIASQSAEIDSSTANVSAISNPSGNSYRATYTIPGTGAASGNKTFMVIASDSTGRSATRTLTLVVDVDKPTLENAYTLNPSFVGFTPNGAFSLRGTAQDLRGLDTVQIQFSNDGSSWSLPFAAVLNAGSWTYALADSASYVPASGSLHVRVLAQDLAGNISDPYVFSFAVDQAADKPTVAVISPVNATTYGSTVQVSGTAADDDGLKDTDNNAILDADAVQIEYWNVSTPGNVISHNPVISGSGRNATWNYSLSGLAGGSYIVRVRSVDDNGTIGDWSANTAFTVDTGVPILNLATIPPAFVSNAALVLTGTVEDSGGVKFVRARINGGSWILATAPGMTDTNVDGVWDSLGMGTLSWTLNLNLGVDGLKTIEVQASDNNDLLASAQRSTTLDATFPVASFDAQFRDNPSGSFLALTELNKMVRITGSVTELNLRETNPIEISIDGAAYVPVTGTFIWSYVWDTSALSGTHTLKLRITDKANNVTESAEQSVTVDQSKDVPRISQAFVAAPLPSNAGLNVLGALLKVSGTLSDDDGYLGNSLEIFLDGSPTALTGTNSAGTTVTWEYTWASLAPGEHYLTLRATDRNGAVANLGPTYFVVDTANPIISLNTPSAGAKIKAGLLEISGTALDDGGFGTNPLRIELRHSNSSSSIDGDVNTPALVGNTFTFTVPIDSAVLDGTLFIDLILSDRSGKQSSLTRAVTIDTTPPSLNLNYPSPGAYINGLVSIVGTADDINGLGELSLKVLDPLNLAIEKANVTRSGTTLSSWEFPFNATSYASATFAHDVNGDGKLWQVWFKLKATDNSGNITELKTGPGPLDYPSFFIDTDGDKPTISVTQPKNGDKIGGFVNMFGTATDDDGPVMQVEVQIDYNGDGDFADSMDINSNGSTQLGVNKTMVPSTTVVRVGDPAQKWEDESAWYEVPVTNGSWTLELNAAGELYKSKTGGTGDLIIRVRSRDMFGLASEISTRTITLDETFPRIDNVSPADQSYQSGDLPLFAEFGDNINLNLSLNSQIKININKTGYQTLSAGPNSGPGHPYSLIADLAEPQNGYDLNYTINTNNYFPGSSGILYVDLYVKDESNYTNQRSFTYYVDNQIPSAAWSDRPGSPDGLNIRNGQVRINGNPALDYAFVEGNFLDSGAVSGISRIELYFVKAGQVQRIRGTSGALSPASSETVSVDEYNEGNGTWSSSTQNLPIVRSSDAGYGDDYVISIDRPTEMSSLSTGTDSDGDSYYEFMGIDGGSQRWRALFNSSYLPDGSIDIHYVVYDLAGNRIHKVRRGFIANQGPSYTRIRLGSDYNNGGTIADVPGAVTEIVDYYNPSLSIDRLASSSPVRVKNGRVYFNVQSNDPNGTIASTVINIVAPSPGTRGLLASLGAGSNVASSTTTPITLSIGSGQFPSAGDYTLEVVVKDNDGITSRRNVVISLLPTSDTTRPIVSPTAMTQANGVYISGDGTPMDPFVKEGHLELQADNPAKWATIRSQYGSDDDPKVSGKVTLKGTISDETRIDEVNITGDGLGTNAVVAQWNAVQGKLISSNGNFIIDSQSMDESEHRISYTFIWDTSTATGTAALNRTVAFQAKDSATLQNISLAHTLLRYDVVPYITTLKRDAAFNTLRSRYGRFLFHRGETLSVHGFNVFNSNADTVSLGGASINLPGGSTKTLATVTVPAAAKSGIVNLSVNGILALNNLNDNDKAWNIEASAVPGIDGSTYWNDDRYLHLWQSDDKQTGTDRGYFAGSIDPEYPAMTIDTSGTNSVLYGSWSNYATSSVNYVGNNSNFTLGTNRIGSSYDPIEHTDIAYGNRPGVIYNANTYGNGVWELTGAGGVVVWDSQADSAISVTGNGYEVEYLYHDRRLMQFTGQRIAYQNNNIHVSYYDTETKALKYWYTASNGNVGYSARWINIDGGFDAQDGDFTEVYGLPGTNGATITNIYVASGVTVTNNQNVMRDSDGNIYRANANGVVDIPISVGSRLANGNDERSILFSIRTSTNRIVDYNANPSLSSRAAAAGEFSAIDTTPTTNYPVIAYYDITNRTVRIARASAVNPNATQWTLQDAMLPGDPNRSFSGKYISMKIDSSGYVHLAFYRNSTGDLIYMKSTNNPTNGTTAYTFGDSVIVDSIGSVGIWADLSLNGTTPYISYIDSSYVNSFDGIKMAYYDAALNGWEIMNAPLSFEVENVRTSIESNTKAGDFWSAAIGYSSPDYFRIAYYVKE